MFFNFCCKISEYLRHRLLLKISIRELTLHEKYKISNKYKKIQERQIGTFLDKKRNGNYKP